MSLHLPDIMEDEDVKYLQWYDSQAEVMQHLAKMQQEGWWVAREGLQTCSGSGSLVARPLKRKGASQYTGVGVWRINPVNEA